MAVPTLMMMNDAVAMSMSTVVAMRPNRCRAYGCRDGRDVRMIVKTLWAGGRLTPLGWAGR